MSLLPQALPLCLVKAVGTVLRGTENRVVPGKEERKKERKGKLRISFISSC